MAASRVALFVQPPPPPPPQPGEGHKVAVSSSPRPWMDVFALPEKYNMAVTESDPDPKVRKMSIPF